MPATVRRELEVVSVPLHPGEDPADAGPVVESATDYLLSVIVDEDTGESVTEKSTALVEHLSQRLQNLTCGTLWHRL